MIDRLRNEMKNNRKRYIQTCQDLILQCMVKMIEPNLKILCRKEDHSELK
jgi:hypothetical protein